MAVLLPVAVGGVPGGPARAGILFAELLNGFTTRRYGGTRWHRQPKDF